jgi:hypothetical protein
MGEILGKILLQTGIWHLEVKHLIMWGIAFAQKGIRTPFAFADRLWHFGG